MHIMIGVKTVLVSCDIFGGWGEAKNKFGERQLRTPWWLGETVVN